MIAKSISASAVSTVFTSLTLMLYLLVPWTATNLVDFFFVRRGHYAITDLFNPTGSTARGAARGLIAYGVGFAAEIPFMVLPDLGGWCYTGPMAKALERRRHRVDRRPDRLRRRLLVLTRSLDVASERRVEALERARAGGGRMTRYTPPDAGDAPRYTGIRTFARAPHVRAGGRRRRRRSASRSTPRPRCVRARASAPPGSATPRCCCGRGTRRRASTCSARSRWPTSATWRRRPATRSGPRSRSRRSSSPCCARAPTPMTLGGDHSIVLGELRAHAAVHGPVAVVLLDAHADTWEQY